MLILSRRNGESIVIGDDTVVTVVRIDSIKKMVGFKIARLGRESYFMTIANESSDEVIPNVTLAVSKIIHGQAKIGIQAPREVHIVRAELLEKETG